MIKKGYGLRLLKLDENRWVDYLANWMYAHNMFRYSDHMLVQDSNLNNAIVGRVYVTYGYKPIVRFVHWLTNNHSKGTVHWNVNVNHGSGKMTTIWK